MTAVVLEGVGKRYGDVWAVRELDLQIAHGETFVLVGGSGSGKTTTLRLLNRLEEASAGRVQVLGDDVATVDAPTLRRRIGYVIQEAGLFDHLDVRGNVGVVPRLLGWDADRIATRVDALLDQVGLPADVYGSRHPAELSGGQRQRVGIARALAADPPLVLLDEPFGALDAVTRAHMQDEFAALAEAIDKTYVLVTHDMREAVRLGDRIGVMHEGRLVRCATAAELVRTPGHAVVEELLGPHRVQLRLMTTSLAAAVSSAGPGDGPPTAVAVASRASVWDALAACDRHDAPGVRIDGHFVDRQTLRAFVLP